MSLMGGLAGKIWRHVRKTFDGSEIKNEAKNIKRRI